MGRRDLHNLANIKDKDVSLRILFKTNKKSRIFHRRHFCLFPDFIQLRFYRIFCSTVEPISKKPVEIETTGELGKNLAQTNLFEPSCVRSKQSFRLLET